MNLVKSMMIFLTVMEEKSVTRAANILHLTPTAVSKQLKQLETHLGQALLIRTTRKIEATDLGQRFYQQCLLLKKNLENTQAFIDSQQAEPQGKLRILSSVYFTDIFLIHYLHEFHQQYPKIALEIDISDRHADLAEEHFDIALGFRQLGKQTDHLRQRKLEDSYFVLAAAPSYLKQHGVPNKPEELTQHILINHPARQPNNMIRFRDGLEIFMPPPKLIINHLLELIKLCCQGAGILMMCASDAAPYFASKKLIQVLPKHPLETFTIYAFYPQTPHESKTLRCFLDFIASKLPEKS